MPILMNGGNLPFACNNKTPHRNIKNPNIVFNQIWTQFSTSQNKPQKSY